ncbi:hypothetical protein [Variovorax sp. GB1P17]|uniref:hypothetical protein n=1 Tax=Variovorax sp. GB1P17 TaxID=3443740 RepID=UPI003F478462
MKRLDLFGERFDRLLVMSQAVSIGRSTRWNCHCDCGSRVVVRSNHLREGATRSCGCFARDEASVRASTHGMSKSPEYMAWIDMRDRCNSPADREYKNYGARGISVCQRWEASFADFYVDVGPRPSENHSLDRIKNGSDYEPGNVRWATAAQQVRNRRVTKLSEEKAAQIRSLRLSGATYKSLAAQFNVSEGSVGFVLSGSQWRIV